MSRVSDLTLRELERIEAILERINYDETADVFRKRIHNDVGGYTLFGEKPATLIEPNSTVPQL